MVMSGEHGVSERSCPTGRAFAPARAGWFALVAFAAGCGGQPTASDSVVEETATGATTTEAADTTAVPVSESVETPPSAQGLLPCPDTRSPITNPGGVLLDTLDRLVGSYPIGGVWGTPLQLDYTPKDVPFEGEIVVSRRDGDLVQLGPCSSGVEVPVAVTVRTNDGALAESVEGTVLLGGLEDMMTVDGSPAPFVAELSARVRLDAPSGTFAFADDPGWIYHYSELRAELVSWGWTQRVTML